MWLLRSLALLLLLFGECARARGRGKRREDDAVASTRRRNGRVLEGKFTARDSSRCTWTASGERTFALKVACEPGPRSEARGTFTCEYAGEPTACAAYVNDTRRYWRQVARALAKQTQLCEDKRAVLRAGMCARAPANAHFRVARPTTEEPTTTKVQLPQGTRTSQCTEVADHRSLAQETCGEMWASICTFLLTIVQSEGDC